VVSLDSSLKSTPYFDYFSAKNGFKQPSAPVPNRTANPGSILSKGYYSYDLGSWHIVALNSNDHCAYVSCSSTSAQGIRLRYDLATNPSACTQAYMHHPLYTTGSGGVAPEVKPLIKILYKWQSRSDQGHPHDYCDATSHKRGQDIRHVIRMDLRSGSYNWRFVAVDGTPSGKVMDSTPTGTESCH
jgi:hypothetical protein